MPFLNFYFSNKSTKKIEKNTNNDKELGTIFKKVCGSTSKNTVFLGMIFFKGGLISLGRSKLKNIFQGFATFTYSG